MDKILGGADKVLGNNDVQAVLDAFDQASKGAPPQLAVVPAAVKALRRLPKLKAAFELAARDSKIKPSPELLEKMKKVYGFNPFEMKVSRFQQEKFPVPVSRGDRGMTFTSAGDRFSFYKNPVGAAEGGPMGVSGTLRPKNPKVFMKENAFVGPLTNNALFGERKSPIMSELSPNFFRGFHGPSNSGFSKKTAAVNEFLNPDVKLWKRANTPASRSVVKRSTETARGHHEQEQIAAYGLDKGGYDTAVYLAPKKKNLNSRDYQNSYNWFQKNLQRYATENKWLKDNQKLVETIENNPFPTEADRKWIEALQERIEMNKENVDFYKEQAKVNYKDYRNYKAKFDELWKKRKTYPTYVGNSSKGRKLYHQQAFYYQPTQVTLLSPQHQRDLANLYNKKEGGKIFQSFFDSIKNANTPDINLKFLALRHGLTTHDPGSMGDMIRRSSKEELTRRAGENFLEGLAKERDRLSKHMHPDLLKPLDELEQIYNRAPDKARPVRPASYSFIPDRAATRKLRK